MNIRNWSFWRDGERLRLRVESEHPWWQFWRARTVTCSFSRGDAIELYQSLAKSSRALMVQGDQDFGLDTLDEFEDDIVRGMRALNPTDDPTAPPVTPYALAKLLIEKGYAKG